MNFFVVAGNNYASKHPNSPPRTVCFTIYQKPNKVLMNKFKSTKKFLYEFLNIRLTEFSP